MNDAMHQSPTSSWWRTRHDHVTLFAVAGSPAQNRIDALLPVASRIPSILADVLDIPGLAPGDEVMIALQDPLVSLISPADPPPFDPATTVTIDFASDAPPVVLVAPLVRHLLRRWFGDGAAESGIVADGLIGCVTAKLRLGPSEHDTATLRAAQATTQSPPQSTPITAQPLAAMAFVAWLLRSGGGTANLRLFLEKSGNQDSETAASSTYGRSLKELEQDWQQQTRQPARKLSAIADFFAYLLPLLKPYGWRQAELLLYMVLGLAFTLILPLSSKYLVDTLIPQGDGTNIVLFVLVLLAIYFANGALTVRRSWVTSWISQHIMVALADRLFTHMQRLPHAFYVKAKIGDLMSRLSNDVMIVQSAMSQVIGQALYQILTALAVAVTIIVLSPLLGLLVIATVPIFAIPYTVLRARIQKASYEQGQLMGEAAASAQEQLAAHAAIKAFGLEQSSSTGYRSRLMAVLDTSMRLLVMGAFFEASVTFAASLGELIMLGTGGYLVMQDKLTLGTLLAFWALLPTLYMPVAAIANLGQIIERASGSVKRLDEILDEPLTIVDRPGATTLAGFDKEIRFDHVTFGYENRDTVHDLSFTIPKGAHVAFVGPSGAGKSTVVNLLLRFWDPGSGTITIDGHDLRDLRLASLRQHIGLVFQDTFVFNTSLRNNIAIGKTDATDIEIIEAAKSAHLHEYIMDLPEGYETITGEHGVQMSGGQRQRLAIARALIRQPDILVFDEATSALDPVTEAEIQRTFDTAGQGRTSIVITHRLSSITSADIIFVLDQGELIEQGNHAELIAAGGLYRQLFDEQSGRSNPGPVSEPVSIPELRAFPILRQLDETQLQTLHNRLVPVSVPAGNAVIRQGESGDSLYLIRHGEVDVLRFDGVLQHRIAELGEGEYFGEISLLTDQPRSATIRTRTACDFLVLSRDAFNDLLFTIPAWAEAVRQVADRRVSLARHE